MKKMNWKGDPNCTVCRKLESADHIFFNCSLAKFIWGCLRDALGWERAPINLQDFMGVWLPLNESNYNLKLFAFAVVIWTIWITHNKMSIEGVFPNSPTDVLCKMYYFMQRWKLRLGASDRGELEEWQPGFPKTACGRMCYPSVDVALRSVRVNEAGVRSRFPNPAGATKYQSLP
jgi:hypothetical protein